MYKRQPWCCVLVGGQRNTHFATAAAAAPAAVVCYTHRYLESQRTGSQSFHGHWEEGWHQGDVNLFVTGEFAIDPYRGLCHSLGFTIHPQAGARRFRPRPKDKRTTLLSLISYHRDEDPFRVFMYLHGELNSPTRSLTRVDFFFNVTNISCVFNRKNLP